ncbi:MAG: transposase [Gammaproteobacteria bacterium]
MARPPRTLIAGIPQHAIQRGNNKQPVFMEFQDYHLFLKFLQEGAELGQCDVHAYVLMTNHVHLLLTPGTERGVIDLMQHIGRRYVRYFNARHHRTGTLWEGRYRSSLVKSPDYFLKCMRYIELNPVRAGMVNHPREYRWSSYRANVGELTDALVTPHAIYDELSSDPFARGAIYAAAVDCGLDDESIQVLRNAANRSRPIEEKGSEQSTGTLL